MIEPTLLALLRDPAAWSKVPAPTPAAHANAMLRAHVLKLLSAALAEAGERAMLVKGAALALDVYPTPASRPMRDVDLLVPPAREEAVIRALASGGLERCEQPGRKRSGKMLGETQLIARAGALTLLVEVHATLDKIVPRPFDIAAIERRASPAPKGLDALLVPAPEDHALLVAQHLASHEYRHPIGLLDLELLLRRGLDPALLVRRAHEARLSTVMFVALATLHALGAASASPDLVAAFAPSPLRRAALALFYDVGRYPVARGEGELGALWILRQTPMRDDLARWTAGLVRYAAARLEDIG